MLESDTTTTSESGNTDSGATNDTGNTGAGRPARKRAPRKTAAKAQSGPVTAEPATAEPATIEPAAENAAAEAAAPAPRKRAPRKATAKAAAPPKAAPAEQTPAATVPPVDAAAESAAVEPAAAPAKRAPRKSSRAKATKSAAGAATADAATTDLASNEPAAEAALPLEAEALAATAKQVPAKRAPRKRAAKKAAPVEPIEAVETVDPVDTVDTVDPTAEDAEPDAAPVAPTVLFMAPQDEAPPTRRRRVAKKAAGAPVAADSREADGQTGPPADTRPPASTDAAEPESDDPESDEDGTDPDDIREAAIEQANGARRRRRRGRRGRGGGGTGEDSTGDDATDETATSDDDTPATAEQADDAEDSDAEGEEKGGGTRRRRRRRRSGNGGDDSTPVDDPPNTVTHVRDKKSGKGDSDDGVRGIKGSTRLEAKRQRRRDGRDTGRRRAPILTEAEFLARREAVDRVMAVRQNGDRTQIAVLEDDILVEHYVTRASATSYVGNVYLGRVQNVLPSMEAAFIDIGKGRNGVLYAGEVNWDAAGLDGKSRTIEHALKGGDSVLVQVTKDPIGHKGARLTSQISLPGRFLVYVPGGGMTGISRRLPDTERHRLKSILKKIVPDEAGVIVRTAAEGASEEDLTHDVERLQAQWESIQEKSTKTKSAPTLMHGEPDLAIRVVRDVFNEDFASLVVEGDDAWSTVSEYVGGVAPDLAERVSRHTKDTDLFHDLRVDEQLAKALDRKVWLPSGGSLVIDRTEAMTVVDVNTGKFVGSGGNLEQTVTRNNLEAAEEIVRQLRLRDVGGIVVIDFIDMVLESNRDLVLRRLTECLGRDRTKHQVAEVTSLGLVQMTRKRVGEGLLEAFSEPCEACHGRGVLIHSEPVDQSSSSEDEPASGKGRRRRGKGGAQQEPADVPVEPPATPEQRQAANAAIAAIHRATALEKEEAAAGGVVAELATNLVAAAMEAGSGTTAPETPVVIEPEAATVTEPETAATTVTEPEAAVVTEPDAAVIPEPESSEVVSSATETPVHVEPDAVHEPAHEPVNGHVATGQPANGASAPGRRRRRAASRPAGPPVATP